MLGGSPPPFSGPNFSGGPGLNFAGRSHTLGSPALFFGAHGDIFTPLLFGVGFSPAYFSGLNFGGSHKHPGGIFPHFGARPIFGGTP